MLRAVKKPFKDWKKFSDDNNILIYQMGKVGSTSLEESIPDSIHIHKLFNNHHTHLFYSPRSKSFIHRKFSDFNDVMRRLAITRRKKVKIITLVRDLYGRNISAFFQNLAFWLVQYSNIAGEETDREDISFIGKTFEEAFDHDYPWKWFDIELKALTGVDVFKYPFDKEKGWSRIQKGKYDILLLKLENLSEATTIIEEFCGYKLNLQNTNVSDNKWYGEVYKSFKKYYVPKEEYLNMLYTSKTATHFYSNEEIESFKKKALKNKNTNTV